ncbi:putative methyltransferase NSUN5, partial [Stegodyphus mimosarum]
MTEQSSKQGHKEHLSKDQRLPRSYKDAEKVLKAAKTCQGNIKTILYSTKFRGGYFNKIYALTHNVLKNTQLLDKIIEETNLLTKEPYLKKEIAQIMIYELVMGRGQLSGKSKPVLTILKYKNDIESAYQCLTKAGIDRFMNEVMVTIPRYARINTLLTTMSDVLDDLKKSGYYHKEYQEDISED